MVSGTATTWRWSTTVRSANPPICICWTTGAPEASETGEVSGFGVTKATSRPEAQQGQTVVQGTVTAIRSLADEVLGREPGTSAFRSLEEYPDGETYPGLFVVRLDGELYFVTADALDDRLREAVVGAEETYLSLGSSTSMSRLTGLPYFPITPTFPWLGLLGLVPLPTKWYIDFGSPISLAEYGADAVTNLVFTAQLSDQVRYTIQDMLHTRLAQRRSVFR